MSAPLHRTYDVLGLLLRFRAFPEETGGKFCLVDCVLPPGLGAPPNAHPGETECFIVVEGSFDFMLGGEHRRAGPGEVVIVPEGAVHAFTNSGVAPGRIMIFNAPGRMHVDFFTGIGRPVPDDTPAPLPPMGPPDLDAVLAVAARAGMTLVPPQPA